MTDRKIQSVIITGPTGSIGHSLISLLAAKGMEVFPVVRPGSARAGSLPTGENIRPVACDISALDTLPGLIPGADAFFHFAWAHTIGPGRNDMSAQIDNIRYTVDACRAAAKLGCRVFVGAGSQAEYGRVDAALTPDTPCFPENGYGMAKLCAGQMSRVECAGLGIDHIWPRILSVYGPYDGERTLISSAVSTLLAGKRLSVTPGTQVWDYLYSDDAACAMLALARHGENGSVYPLGSGRSMPLKNYILELRDMIDPDLPVGFGDIPFGPLQVMHLEADISALYKDTGFQPGTDFSAGIRQTIQWMRSRQA